MLEYLLVAILLVLFAILLTLSPLTRRLLRWLGMTVLWGAVGCAVAWLYYVYGAPLLTAINATDPHTLNLAFKAWLNTPLGWAIIYTIDGSMVALVLFAIGRAIYENRKMLRMRAFWVSTGHNAAISWRAQDLWTRCVQTAYAILFGGIALAAIGKAIVNAFH